MDANLNNLVGASILLKRGNIAKLVGCSDSYMKVICNGEQSITSIKTDELIAVVNKPDYSDREDEFVMVLESESGISKENAVKDHKVRKGELVEFRYLHMLFRNAIMGLSLSLSASIYRKDHATTIHARKKLSAWYHTDKGFRKSYPKTIKYITDIDENAFDYEPKRD